MKSLKLMVILMAVSTAATALGAPFNVTNPAEFQNALNAAAANNEDDTINVAAGIYNITATLTYLTDDGDGGHTITIQGAGAAATVLSGGGTTQIMNITTDAGMDGGDSGGHVVVRAMTFRGGFTAGGSGGGAFLFSGLANVTCEDNNFIGNSAADGGGVVAVSQYGSVIFTGNTLTNNTSASDGGGATLGSASGMMTAVGNTFTGNTASSTGLLGGGGGLAAIGNTGSFFLSGNEFSGNNASFARGGGAAVLILGGGAVTLTDNSFSDNSAALDGGGAWVFSGTGPVSFLRNIFSGNTASVQGGGSAAGSNGGATFADNVFLGNSASIGGGLVTGSGLSALSGGNVVNNTFSGNTASDQGGGLAGVLFGEEGTLNIYNNIFWNNSALAGGGDGDDVYVETDIDENSLGGPVNIFNNDFSGAADFLSGQSEDLFVTLTDDYAHGGNIQQDPMFVNLGIGDVHLQAGSPCIDMGDNSAPSIPATDIDGGNRFVDGNGDITAIADMGADEFEPVVPSPVNSVDVPAMTEWGMIIFMALAGIWSIQYLGRRQKTGEPEVD